MAATTVSITSVPSPITSFTTAVVPNTSTKMVNIVCYQPCQLRLTLTGAVEALTSLILTRATCIGGTHQAAATDAAVQTITDFVVGATTPTVGSYIYQLGIAGVAQLILNVPTPGEVGIMATSSAGTATITVEGEAGPLPQGQPIYAQSTYNLAVTGTLSTTGVATLASAATTTTMTVGSTCNVVGALTVNTNKLAVNASTGTMTLAAGAVLNVVGNASGGLKIGAATDYLGFYSVTPIQRALLATGVTHTVDDVITALQNLGLVKQS